MQPGGRERGAVTVEMVVLMPVLLATLFGGIQAGVVFHARHIAIAAAQEGARTAAAYQASLPDGISAATTLASDWGGQNLAGIHVTGHRTTTRVEITVQAAAVSLLPGISWPIEQSATLPVERLE
ncbi:MAG: pilus assembly protein [Actinobacteria bacterium]|nr:pilus assembly protein [Actinomycetota bacterium]